LISVNILTIGLLHKYVTAHNWGSSDSDSERSYQISMNLCGKSSGSNVKGIEKLALQIKCK